MPNYYTRFRDPRVNYVMVVIGIQQEDGTFGSPFHVRMSEEEYDDYAAQSRRQYERGQWPGDTRANYIPADRRERPQPPRSYPDEPFREPPRQSTPKAEEPPTFHFTSDDGPFNFFFETGESRFQQAFREEKERAEREQQRQRERNQGKKPPPQPTTAPKRNDTQARMRLAEMAGIQWPTELENRSLYKRAQRRCHPDVESGSHEKWIELEGIARQLRLIIVKDTTGASRPQSNWSGRSGG